MAIKVPVHVIPDWPAPYPRNQYSDSLQNMFKEAVRIHPNFGTYSRWQTTDFTGCFSELKNGFLAYKN